MRSYGRSWSIKNRWCPPLVRYFRMYSRVQKGWEPLIKTIPTTKLLYRFIPEIYSLDQDLEKFIRSCGRYFDMMQVRKKDRAFWVEKMIHEDLEEAYIQTADKVIGFEARLRLAFGRPKKFISDIEAALKFRQGEEDVDIFFRKVEELTDKILAHKLEKEALMSELLLHCSKNPKVREEVKLRKLSKVAEIKETIRVVTEIEKDKKISEDRTYKDVVAGIKYQRPPQQMINQNRSTDFRRERLENFQCWTCQRMGHVSRLCPERKKRICYGCGIAGHIR